MRIFDISIDGAVEFYREKLNFSGLTKKTEGDEIVVTSGMPDEDLNEEVLTKTHGEKTEEPTFEIVPKEDTLPTSPRDSK